MTDIIHIPNNVSVSLFDARLPLDADECISYPQSCCAENYNAPVM